MPPALADQPLWIWAVGPFFAALAGIGFKEFFCFQPAGGDRGHPAAAPGPAGPADRPAEPPALVSWLLALKPGLLLVLCLRKFPMPAAADVGDKSVFAYLETQRRTTTA